MPFFFGTISLYIIERASDCVKMSDSKIKKITIAILILCILVMSVAYASLFQRLRISGNASVTASWKVEITGIKEGNKTGGASSISVPSYTSSTANFNARLTNVSDSIEYLVTIKNSGEIDAKLNSIITSKTGSDAIVYEIIGVSENDVIKKGETLTVTVKVSIDPKIGINEPSINTGMTLIFNYIQNV